MELNGYADAARERRCYALPLGAGMRIAFAGLVAAFLAYVSGALPSVVALEALARTWTLPASEFLRATGMPPGWGWLGAMGQGDVLTLAAIAVLALVPLVALLALVPFYAARKDWIYLTIVLAQIGVIALAASGILVSAH